MILFDADSICVAQCSMRSSGHPVLPPPPCAAAITLCCGHHPVLRSSSFAVVPVLHHSSPLAPRPFLTPRGLNLNRAPLFPLE